MAFADRLLLNKCDLVNDADLARVEGRLKSINGMAPIVRCTNSEVSVECAPDPARGALPTPWHLPLEAHC